MISNRILKSLYNLLYNQLNWMYDYVAYIVSFGSWNNWLYSLVPYIYGPAVLEIGFGPGHLVSKISSNRIWCFGIDASWNMCRYTYREIDQLKVQPNIVFGIAQHLPFEDEIFDQVMITFPGDYIFYGMTVSEISRVMRISGDLYIIPYAWFNRNKWYHRLVEWYYPRNNNFLKAAETITEKLSIEGVIWDNFIHLNKNSSVMIMHGLKVN